MKESGNTTKIESKHKIKKDNLLQGYKKVIEDLSSKSGK